jgi:hypothetical protein
VKLDMLGINWFTGGHKDHYIAEFYDFQANPEFPVDTFTVPPICDGASPACVPP